jgi:hypothetical protein
MKKKVKRLTNAQIDKLAKQTYPDWYVRRSLIRNHYKGLRPKDKHIFDNMIEAERMRLMLGRKIREINKRTKKVKAKY